MEVRLREVLAAGRFVPLRDYLEGQLARGPLPTGVLPRTEPNARLGLSVIVKHGENRRR